MSGFMEQHDKYNSLTTYNLYYSSRKLLLFDLSMTCYLCFHIMLTENKGNSMNEKSLVQARNSINRIQFCIAF